MHMENRAGLIKGVDKVTLAPWYDFVPLKGYIPEKKAIALSVTGKRINLSDVRVLADTLKLAPRTVEFFLRVLYDAKDQFIRMTAYSEISTEWQRKFLDVINSHSERIEAV
jgi:hypothetical protein